jgi:pilus assembly protein TadC
MSKIDPKLKKLSWIISAASAIAIILFGVLIFWGTSTFDEVAFFAIVAAVFPPAILTYVDYRWKRAIDEHLPDLFRSIVQAQETGMTLPQALEEAAKRDYGPLTAQLRASRSGGRVEKVFDPMGKFIQTTLLLDKERRTQTRPYIAIIYVAFLVFLFTIILLFKSFFVNLEQLPSLGTTVMAPEDVKRLFFHMTTIQAFFGGLVAGKMGEDTVIAGLKHCLIMMLCGYLALKIFM